MDLIAIAVPFFLLALVIELAVDRIRGTGYYRSNDALNSLSAGTLSTTFGYFTKLLPAAIWAYVLQGYAIFDIGLGLFDTSPTGLMYWFVALVAFDFCYYWAHRCGHEISILWAAHSVHHQSEDYNLSTALRQTSTGFLFSWIFYLPLFLIGMPFEVFITVDALDLIYQFWVHTQHVRRLGWLEYVFVTPSNHRVHHAQNEVYIDRNYGGVFILWDRLFGSFQDELVEEPVVFGVRKPLRSWNPFWANLQVYDYLMFDAVHTRRWQDKIAVWFRRTGWRPADMMTRFPKPARDVAAFEKYDPAISAARRWYVIVQFVVGAVAVLWIGQVYATHGLAAVVIPCVVLWVLLYAIGALNEGRHAAHRVEISRLLFVVPAAVYWLLHSGLVEGATQVWLLTAIYCCLSVAGLYWSGENKALFTSN